MGRRRRYVAVAAVVGILAVGVALLLAAIPGRQAHPRGFNPRNFMRHIAGRLRQYVANTGATTLPANLRVVSDFMGLRGPKDLVGYRTWHHDVQFERIRYVGAGRPVDSATRTLVLIYSVESKQEEPPCGILYYFDHGAESVNESEWLAVWEGSEPIRWE